jgi:hypothetical protein
MSVFFPATIDSAKEFLMKHHWGVLATRRQDGKLQMSPITPGLDAEGRVIISSRETAYKVKICAVIPAPPFAFSRPAFIAEAGFKSMGLPKSCLFTTRWTR